MNLEDFREAWKCQNTSELSKLEPGEMVEQLQAEQRVFDRVMRWSDIFVAVVYISVLALIWSAQSGMVINWPRHLAAVFILCATAYHPLRNRLRKIKEQQLGDSLRDELLKKRGQLDYRIRFSRWSSIWGYYLPTTVALCPFYWQWYVYGELTLSGVQWMALGNIVFLSLLGYGAGGLGIKAARMRKQDIDQELEALECPVADDPTPMPHRVARAALVFFTVAVCVYLAISAMSDKPRTGSPVEPLPPFDQLGSFDEAEKQQLVEWLHNIRVAGDYPSVMVAIVGDGRVLYQHADGYADIGEQREATPETLWHVESVTKALIDALAAKLHERGAIDLDAFVANYLPSDVQISEQPGCGARITLRQLASHT